MALPDWMLPIKKELDTKIEVHCERLLKIRMEKIEKQGKMMLDMGYQLSDLTIIRYSDGRELQWEVWPVSLVEHRNIKVADFTNKDVEEWLKKLQPTMGVDMDSTTVRWAGPIAPHVQVLQWTQAHPTTGGYYWRRTVGVPDFIVFVRIRRDESPVSFTPQWYNTADDEWVKITGTQDRWAGPIAPPM